MINGIAVDSKLKRLYAPALATKNPLTRSQRLALALKTCEKLRSKKARARCQKAARQRYGAKRTNKHRKGKK
ncbi:MAG: hypothetical protein FWD42_00325, partial [Solirubrobacterales bacterium]|nr:hypothetical protein [Solirubrobacterales bacterium]